VGLVANVGEIPNCTYCTYLNNLKGRKFMNEQIIRDLLAKQITMISTDLIVIKTEYHLKNIDGTDGFIDILAKDTYNNYVIIEVKKSNQTARQALHEVIKYARLLKTNLKVKESEIRIIIVSTKWNELLVPFSEIIDKVSYLIEGYKCFYSL